MYISSKTSSRLLRKTLQYLLVSGLFLCCTFLPVTASAYIGPGAGFAVGGSFLVLFTALASAFIILLTWPIRAIVRAIRFRRVYARSRIKKAIVLGFDGMDHALTTRMLDEGKLPNFAKLKGQGCFKPLLSTIPPISPVAWSSFQTGVNPGKHNIFDFLTRDRKTYAPKLSSTDIKGPLRSLSIGRYKIPLGRGDIRLLRKGVPFWKTLGEQGIFSTIIRVPITFPPEQFYGLQLAAMCTPDLRGSQGIFSFYTTSTNGNGENTGGEVQQVTRTGNRITAELAGPHDPMLKARVALKCPFEITIQDAQNALLQLNGATCALTAGQYSDWIPVTFKASLGTKVRGICRFLLIAAEPDFKLYVTPINIDPDKPVMPISHPQVYATYLAKRQGRYATLGLAEDSWALNEQCISDGQFIEQCLQADRERERMFFDAVDNITRGLCVCVFDGTDRVQHSFWRQLDPEHPFHRGCYLPAADPEIEKIYRNADRILGETMEKCRDSSTLLMVISDHGFNSFRYGIDLNRWLEENGYLALADEGRGKKNLTGVDWTKTRAFAIGLSGIYLNLTGREARGIVDPGTEAVELREEIAEKLRGAIDPIRNSPIVKQVYNAMTIYRGPYKQDAPDLLVGYHAGYRAAWETAVGEVTGHIVHDNVKAWSGDHCIDQSLVPGILFSNRMIHDEHPRLMDIGPTILDLFGVIVPSHMDGKPLQVDGPVREAIC
jgi:predicted AlkP superfamily phosphohydrolase/phosphomutase